MLCVCVFCVRKRWISLFDNIKKAIGHAVQIGRLVYMTRGTIHSFLHKLQRMSGPRLLDARENLINTSLLDQSGSQAREFEYFAQNVNFYWKMCWHCSNRAGPVSYSRERRKRLLFIQTSVIHILKIICITLASESTEKLVTHFIGHQLLVYWHFVLLHF